MIRLTEYPLVSIRLSGCAEGDRKIPSRLGPANIIESLYTNPQQVEVA